MDICKRIFGDEVKDLCSDKRKEERIVWLAVNAKYSHTSLAVRYLRACVPGSEVMELTINHLLLDALGEIYERQPRVLGIACYIWNIELVRKLLRLLPEALPQTIVICGGPEVSYDTAAFLQEFPMVDFVVRGEGEELCRHSSSACAPWILTRPASARSAARARFRAWPCGARMAASRRAEL